MQNAELEPGAKYKEIIKKMDYGTNFKTIQNLEDFMKEYLNYIIFPRDVNTIQIWNVISGEVIAVINRMITRDEPNGVVAFSYFDKNNFILRLIDEISKNFSLICDLEVITRGILFKDTEKIAVPMIISCLQSYVCHNIVVNTPTKKDFDEFCIPDNFFLGHFGSIFGKCISSGCPIYLKCQPQMILTACLFAKLCVNAGYPKKMISVKPVLDCQHTERFECFKVSNFTGNKIPMIIFNNADLDSACITAIEGVWGYQGNLPWTINTILIQEDILHEFLNKFKHQMRNLRYGLPNDKLTDISFPRNKKALDKLNTMINMAARLGIQVFQADNNLTQYQPTIFIGEYVCYNYAITSSDYIDIPYATILSFRNTAEAIELSNNCRQNLAASIWTENIGIANEVAKKLNVNHIWINCYGMFPTNINYLSVFKTNELSEELPNYQEILKEQAFWKKCSYNDRLLKMYKLAEELDEVLQEYFLDPLKLNQTPSLQLFRKVLRDTLRRYQLLKNPVSPKENYLISTQITPLNVIYIALPTSERLISERDYEFLCCALLHGNAVAVYSDHINFLDKKVLSSCKIPSNLLTIISSNPQSEHLRKLFDKNNEISKAYFCGNIDNYCNIKYIWQTCV